MKLSKKQLEDFIVGSMRDNGENGWGSEDEHSALEALRNDSLEIEGYEKTKWTKFDPDDQKTFPPKNTVVLVMICKALSDGTPKKMSVEVFNEYHMPNWLGGTFTHWRPLPKPPVESEK